MRQLADESATARHVVACLVPVKNCDSVTSKIRTFKTKRETFSYAIDQQK
jgi:hypothetical protein